MKTVAPIVIILLLIANIIFWAWKRRKPPSEKENRPLAAKTNKFEQKGKPPL